MEENNQPTLSAEQMAEVRAAVAAFSGEHWEAIGSHLSALHGDEDCWETTLSITSRNYLPEPNQHMAMQHLATILNAVPALLALADEAVRLRGQIDMAAEFWRPVARDLEHNILSIDSVRFLAQDFLSMLLE